MLRDSATDSLDGVPTGFSHDAFVYTSDEEFVRLATPFVRDGLATGEAIVAALPPTRIALLRKALGPKGEQVGFIDVTVAGRNPARLIPLWRDALERNPGRPVRGLGDAAGARRAVAVRRAEARHGRVAGQLHPPTLGRRRPGRARRAGLS